MTINNKKDLNMARTKQDEARYTRHGYKDRDDYLSSLADNHGIDQFVVNTMADILGDSEDFDGLVSELEDLQDLGLLDDFAADTEDGSDKNGNGEST
jgi:hypothetical protein